MNFDVTILGCGAATPTKRHRPTAQIVSIRDHLFLVDCGEGTQMQLRDLGIKMQRISHILISHLHGDHFYGLIGLLSTYALLGRTKELVLIAPPELESWIASTLKMSASYLTFPLLFIPSSAKDCEVVWENEWLTIHSIPLKHRIQCNGFLFQEKDHERKLIKSIVKERNIGITESIALKKNIAVHRENGEVIVPDAVCEPPALPRRYFFCTDTLPIPFHYSPLLGVDLLYHESTFLEEHSVRAKATFHCTARQAAQVAVGLQAHQLILGHFSARYGDLNIFLEESQTVFSNASLAVEGKTWSIPLRFGQKGM